MNANLLPHQQLTRIFDFRQPVKCHGYELAEVIAAAKAAGYRGHILTRLPNDVHELLFVRNHPMLPNLPML